MRLLLIAPEVKTLEAVRSFSGVWSWYLSRELRRRGIDFDFSPPVHLSGMTDQEVIRHYRKMDLSSYDHILALGTRYFERVPETVGKELMMRMPGAVTQVHDAGRPVPFCDCTFTLRNDRVNDFNHYVGWAADHELIIPRHIPGELRILIDHPDYGLDRLSNDISSKIIVDCQKFMRSEIWRSRYQSIRLRRIADGMIEDVCTPDVPFYQRKAVPFPEVCDEYSKTHLFIVTHPESVGLSVLETAMAGATVLSPLGFIQPDRLDTVRALKFRGDIPWEHALDHINIKASRRKALENSWSKVAARMLVYFKNFKKREC